YLVYIRAHTNIAPGPVGIDRNPWYPLIVKPQVDSSGKVVAIAGMTVDSEYFVEKALPEAMERHLKEFFPGDYSNVMVAVTDEEDMVITGNSEVTRATAEASQRFGFIFQRWVLMTRMRGLTEEQWARRNFLGNLALGATMTLFLICGVALALRTA